jgi:hypothetical protein
MAVRSGQPSPASTTRSPRPAAERHDLLALQRAAGNRSVVALVAVQRDPPPTAEGEPTDAERVVEAQASYVELVVDAASDLVGTPEVRGLTPLLSRRLGLSGKVPKAAPVKSTDPLADVATVLWGDDVKEAASTIWNFSRKWSDKYKKWQVDSGAAKERRREVFAEILRRLLPSALPGADVGAPEEELATAPQVAAEQALLAKHVKRHIDDWEKVRVAFLVQFGALEVGPRAAIQRANAYYAQLVDARLFGVERSMVHPVFQERLDRASLRLTFQTMLKPALRDEITQVVTTFWGTNIRPNANAPHRLSDHSFGWAIDIDPRKNPNIGSSAALAPVTAVTGDNPFLLETAGRSAADVEAVATELRRVSDEYRAAMTNEASLTPVLSRLAREGRERAGLDPLPGDPGSALYRAATAKSADARVQQLLDLLHPESVVAAPVVKTKKKGKKKERVVPPEIRAAVTTIAMIGAAHAASFTKTGKKVAGKSEARPGSVAAQGFMSLPAKLVGALAGSDAGGLQWLGTENQDFMHFQLFPGDRPPLFA